MASVTWLPGSVVDNLDKFANSLGYQNAGIALQLSLIPWESVEDRDAFIEQITDEDVQGGTEKTYAIKKFRS